MDESGNILFRIGKEMTYCSIYSKLIAPNNSCQKIQQKAMNMAMNFGSTYIFTCPSNLNSMVFPLINKNVLFGSVFVGPFIMDDPDYLLLPNKNNLLNCSTNQLLDLFQTSSEIKYISPSLATHIGRTLHNLLSNLQGDSREQFNINQEKLHQQSKINEAIQLYKTGTMPVTSSYPIDKEKELISRAKTGDTEKAKSILNDLLGYVFFSEGSSLESVKFRSIELCSLLSRAAIEGGASSSNILSVNESYLHSLQSINSVDSLCYKLQSIIDIFVESMNYNFTNTSNITIKKATKYIANNFPNNITLENVADEVHLSPAYFSSLFKQAMGISFKDYLNYVRIEESKRLLSNTDYSILDIAVATGYEDQSYFSKVFKKRTGLSPGKYRK